MAKTYTIANSLLQEIEVGDWVDFVEGIVDADPVWGLSFEVVDISDDFQPVVLLFADKSDAERSPIPVDATIITGNYRKVPYTAE